MTKPNFKQFFSPREKKHLYFLPLKAFQTQNVFKINKKSRKDKANKTTIQFTRSEMRENINSRQKEQKEKI